MSEIEDSSLYTILENINNSLLLISNELKIYNTNSTTCHITLLSNNNYGWVSGEGDYTKNTTISIQAYPSENCVFTSWQDNNNDNPRIINVTGNLTYTANFIENSKNTYGIKVKSNNYEYGNILGSGNYLINTYAAILAIPNSGYIFLSWDDGNVDNPRIIKVEKDKEYIALFGLNLNNSTLLNGIGYSN